MRRRLPPSPPLLTCLLLAVLTAATLPAADGPQDGILRLPAAERVVAMADWHGDLEAARRALRLAGAIDDRERWIGGPLVVVQTGDQLDRGDRERAILDLLDRLGREAAAAGGAVHVLLGNHEIMNADGDFRYVTEGGWTEFADLAEDPVLAAALQDTALRGLPPDRRPRAAALRPGGPYARRLAEHPVALIIGRDLFVHGGVLPEHLAYGLERLNRETRRWLRGEGPRPPLLQRRDSPVWARTYCADVDSTACGLLAQVLADLDCDRLFMGHTIQSGGIAAHCDGRAWCLDTGAAGHYGGPVQVAEITAGGVRIIE